jgi:diacylglycerol kinase (ATP)
MHLVESPRRLDAGGDRRPARGPARAPSRARIPSRGDTIQIVATPGSGRGRAAQTALRLRGELVARGRRVQLEVFEDLSSLQRWTATPNADFSLLVCIGGDGTISTAAAAALRRSVPFLPVPSGFGNLVARALAMPSRVDHLVDLVERGRIVRMDVGVRNGKALFLCHESYGFLADIQDRAEAARAAHPRARWRRWLGYYRTALRHVRDAALAPLRVIVDGRVVTREAAVVTVANVATYGPWLPLTPEASPFDGLFDVFVMPAAPTRTVVARLLRRQLRLPGRDHGVECVRGRRVAVAGPRRARDVLELVPHWLPVVVPSEAVLAFEPPESQDVA